MNIVCPFCGTEYRYPGDKQKNSLRFRCSVCKNVFAAGQPETEPRQAARDGGEAPVPAEERKAPSVSMNLSLDPSGDGAASLSDGRPLTMSGEEKSTGYGPGLYGMKEQRSPAGKYLFLLLLLIILSAGAFYAVMFTESGRKMQDYAVAQYHSLFGGSAAPEKEDAADSGAFSIDRHISLLDIKQYIVKNSKTGTLLVIEGKVRNNYRMPCEMIQVEAALTDKNGTTLVTQRRLAGSYISEAQLSLLDKNELESLINSKAGIISNNFHVLQGGEVPFTVAFQNFPLEATDYKVRVVGAELENTRGNLTE